MAGRGEVLRRPEEERAEEAPAIQLSEMLPVRREVEREVAEARMNQAERASRVAHAVHEMFDSQIRRSDDVALQGDWNDSSLSRYMKIPDLFDSCDVQYAYNQRQKIYSIRVTLDNRPRIITVRTGANFTELSLSDLQGNVLEMARQEDGRGIRFRRTE
ncbi:hypothetical protein GF318_00625 [Candidatus Micrarchaeota archaeon]|nr:hypothetical protein [Candidatus Micrarchaeota archaeon]